jgi:tight adherence protein B
VTHSAIILALFFTGGLAAVASALTMGGGNNKRLLQRVALATGNMRELKQQQAASAAQTQSRQFGGTVRRVFSFGMPRTWAMTANWVVLVAGAAGLGGAAWLFAREVVGFSPLLTLAATAAGFMIGPRFILSRQQKRAEKAFGEAFPDAVDSVTRMLQAGMPIASALRAVASEAPPPVSGVFNNIADQMNIGVTIADALDTSSKNIGLPDFRFFAVAVVLQSATGGNLVATLERLSEIMRKRRAVRKKAKAITSEVKFTAYLLGALPFVTIGGLLAIQPDYLNILFTDPRGRMVVWIAVGMLAAAVLTIRGLMGSINNV